MEELDIKDLLITMWEKKKLIIIITAIFIVVGIIYSFLFVTPKYESYTSLLLAKNSEVEGTKEEQEVVIDGEVITQTDLNLNKSLVATYSNLLTSKMVLRDVINNLKTNTNITVPDSLKEENLKKNIKVTAVEDTDIIKISVQNENPELAKEIAKELSNAFIKKINEIYNINNVYVVDEPEVNNTPINVNHIKDIVIFILIGIVISCMIILVIEMLNTKVKTVSDIEKITDIPVLVEISLMNNKKEE